MSADLKPCPFCGAGTTEIKENGRMWLGQQFSAPVSVSVRHWCEPVASQPSRLIERVGRDHESAIAAWNQRAEVLPVVATRLHWNCDGQIDYYEPAESIPWAWEYEPPDNVDRLVRKADADAALASLQARLDAAERDAARYRWLRDDRERQTALCLLVDGYWSPRYTAADVDAAIDDATQEGTR